MKTYPSIEAFYDEAPPEERRFSPEVDFGVFWTDEPGPAVYANALPLWRVSWVENTGEVIAVEHRSGEVRVYGAVEGRDNVEMLFGDWAEHCGVGGLAWVADRASPAPYFV